MLGGIRVWYVVLGVYLGMVYYGGWSIWWYSLDVSVWLCI